MKYSDISYLSDRTNSARVQLGQIIPRTIPLVNFKMPYLENGASEAKWSEISALWVLDMYIEHTVSGEYDVTMMIPQTLHQIKKCKLSINN